MEIDANDIEIITNEILSNIKLRKMNSLKNRNINCNQLQGKKINSTQTDISNTIISILAEIQSSLLGISKEKIQELIELINFHKRIFIAGIGRSGLIGRAFIMRLMQIGFTVFVVGETTTQAIKPNDLLISISGSGRTSNSINIIKKAKDYGVYTFLITANRDSPMAKIADKSISIPTPTKFQNNTDNTGSQLIGSLFEQSAFILLECVVDILSKSLGLKYDEIMKRHANLE